MSESLGKSVSGHLRPLATRPLSSDARLSHPASRSPFQWKTYDSAFSKLEVWFRFVFLVLTFIVIVSAVPLTRADSVDEL